MSDPKETVASEVVETVKVEAKTEKKTEDVEPHWLGARLERERANTLKKAGFESLEDAQASATELKAKREADKTSADKAAEALSRAKKAESGEKALLEAVSVFANSELSGLTAEQKTAVTAIAGDNPADQLKAIAALRPTWTKPEAAKQETAKAVDTAPPPNAPNQTSTSETNHKAQYEALKKSNPIAAASYGLAHSAEVYGSGT